jgi:two-component system cell cycle response regulator DivK
MLPVGHMFAPPHAGGATRVDLTPDPCPQAERGKKHPCNHWNLGAGTRSQRYAIVLTLPRARVAQWIRAFASGAKGRRFDPCRGYQVLPNPPSIAMEGQLARDYAAPQQTILLVEDFDDTRLMMKLWLMKKGYRVIEAESGEEAISLAQSERPDLIIMDVMMPGLNGLDATRRIREYQSLQQTPIVAVSAYGADQYREKAIDAGCDEYVSTPFEPDALGELIERLLAR